MSDPQGHNPVFQIGLVMAGAVSAGAYTAGVVDFLLQALDTWHKQTQDDEPQNPHDVRIKVMSGASAGGMTAALVAATAHHTLDPVTIVPPQQELTNNKLYDAWVKHIDISRLLGTNDLGASDSQVVSLLDGTVLDEIADYVFSGDQQEALIERPYFDPSLHVLLSVTNLRGVPYSIRFQGNRRNRHEISLHADHMHFIVGQDDKRFIDAIRLDPQQLGDPGWQMIQQAALASGAFPIGLPPRVLHRSTREYEFRKWWVPLTAKGESELRYQRRQHVAIPPVWPTDNMHEPGTGFTFLSVDGGLMNNEPLELARTILAGEEMSNPRGGSSADRAVIMIDPFPDVIPFKVHYKPDPSLLSVALQMFSSLRHQATFKLDELQLAYAGDVYSRFLIAPSRQISDRQPVLACGSLGAFGGFFSRRFREHDFQLGRRNCQRFLSKYFRLPESNPLFDRWSPELREQYRFMDGDQAYLPIVPLVDDLSIEIELPEWPRIPEQELEALEPQLRRRMDMILRRLLPYNPILKFVARIIWWARLRGVVLNKVMTQLKDGIEGDDLLTREVEL